MTLRYALLDKIIRLYGFENDITVHFAEMVENDKIDYATLKAEFLYLSTNWKELVTNENY